MATYTQTPTGENAGLTDSVALQLTRAVPEGGAGLSEPAPTVNLSPLFGEEYQVTPTSPSLNITDTGTTYGHFLTVTEPTGLTEPAPVVTKTTGGSILKSFEDGAGLTDYGIERAFVETQTDTALNYNDLDGFNKNLMPSGYNTMFGIALAGGGVSSFVTIDGWFATNSGTAGAGGEDGAFSTGFQFVSINGRAIASGNTSVMGIGTWFSTGTGAATASGGLTSLWGPDAKMTTSVGIAAATGRGGVLYTGTLTPLSGAMVVAWADATALLAPSPSQAFLPTLVPSQSVRFAVDPWRLRNGVAVAEARYAAQASTEVALGSSSADVPFVAPAALTNFAQFRWLATNYDDSVQWYPVGTSSDYSEIRSWQMVKSLYTWDTAAQNTWATLLNNTQDPDIPVWSETGAAATLRADYTYWRIDEYVTNPAVLITPGVSLSLGWGIGTSPIAQITVVLVFVPRLMQTSSFELLRASNEISVSLRSDATVSLTYGAEVLSTTAVGALSRPNEPVAVAVSISPNDRRLMLGVMDTEVRVTSAAIPATVSVDNLAWTVNADEAGTFELLEAAMLLDPLYPATMSTWLNRYDRVYGVTLV